MSQTISRQITLDVIDCGECQIVFAIPASMNRNRYEDGGYFYCPNGHRIRYLENENTKLKAQLDQAKARADHEKTRREEAERSNVALRGVNTKLKKRTGNGVCPVPDCHRSFVNLADHVRTKHPDWNPENADR